MLNDNLQVQLMWSSIIDNLQTFITIAWRPTWATTGNKFYWENEVSSIPRLLHRPVHPVHPVRTSSSAPQRPALTDWGQTRRDVLIRWAPSWARGAAKIVTSTELWNAQWGHCHTHTYTHTWDTHTHWQEGSSSLATCKSSKRRLPTHPTPSKNYASRVGAVRLQLRLR